MNNDGNADLFTGVYGYWLDPYPDNGDRNVLYLGDETLPIIGWDNIIAT